MTRPVDAAAIRRFLEAISRQAGGPTTVYLVGGSTAVEQGWRASTIDPDALRAAVTELLDRRG